MANLLAPVAKAKFFDNNGRPAAGYKLFSYEAGTNTKLATYTDETTGTPNSNPVVLDYRGEANVWVPPNVAYKFVFAPPTDTDPPTAPIWTVDDIVDSQLVTLWGGVDTGIANAYVLNFTSNFTSYTDGIVIYWIPANTNTGASTINVNGLGPVAITNQDGSALYLGQLRANQVALIIYRSGGFILIPQGALLPTVNVQNGDYTFQLSDANNVVLANNVGTSHWTVPNNATVPFPVGTSITLIVSGVLKQIGLGAGVTMQYFSNVPQPIVLAAFAATVITKIGTDTWQQVTPSIYGFTSVPFVGNLTGISGATTISIAGAHLNGLVKLLATSSRVNTSTSTALTITGLPASLTPSANVVAMCYGIRDNGVDIPAVATVTSGGVIEFQRASFPPSAFTASGDKGVIQGWSLVYPLS